MNLGRLTYNTLIGDKSWNVWAPERVNEDEKNYLALATKLMKNMSAMHKDTLNHINERSPGKGKYDDQEYFYLPWRFENPDNLQTKLVLTMEV